MLQEGTRGFARLAAYFHSGVALAALFAAMPALAQTSVTAPETPEEVLVTGSRIRGIAPVGSAVLGLNRDDVVASGAVTSAQLIQQVPQVFNLGVSENSRGQTGGSSNITYGTGINLRGLGPYATLTLLNGHRAVPQGTNGQALDPSVIPTIALQRVEIVADGASAIYGSDAVAGVVNLILRRNVEGVETQVHFGTGDSYWERQLSAIAGHSWTGGHVTLAYENGYHSALSGRDRSYFRGDLTAAGGGDFRVVQCNPGTLTVSGVTYAIPAGGVTQATVGSLVPNTSNKCDNIKDQDLIPEQNHNSLAFTLNQDINDRISVFAEGFAAERTFRFRPALTNATLTVPRANPFFVAPAGSTATTETVAYAFGTQLPQNTSVGYSRAVQAYVGGDVQLFGDWKAGAVFGHGVDTDYSNDYHRINNAAVAAALADTNPATALNPFGGPNNPATLAKLGNTLFGAPGRGVLQTGEVKADGSLFHLPGGNVRLAVGGEWQHYTLYTGSDGGFPGAETSTRFVLGRTVRSGYGEMVVPIFGPENALPGLQKLNIDVAGRIDKYSDVGSTRNPKVGVDWMPLDGLTLRGSYGTSFRAPLLTQLRASSQGLFVQNYSDPTRGGAVIQGVALSGGNLNLVPETATTRSFGAEYQPAFLPRAKIGVSYFSVNYANQITSYLADLTVLNRESQFAGTGIINRNPSAATMAALLAQYPVLGGVIPPTVLLFVDGRQNNLSTTRARGWDFDLSYDLPTTPIGDFRFGFNATYFTSFKTAITSSAALVDQLNTIFNPLKFKARGSVAWTKDNWTATGFVNYQNSYTNNLATPVQRVDANTTVDGHLAYQLDNNSFSWLRGVTIALDVTNLFDKDPPFVNIAQSVNGGGGFDPTVTSPVGRVVALTISKKW
ncbi:TonB-dependent receptor domain-containing protein [Roseiterribacter gracilis]|uniref:TonB-dependent receptor n=1 Tax=Roseiterribacter gracilis TaxID=2812848 RepID=A0A8S8XL97_9PROT|nr:TonB-dependent receptor [Rhodospirillales bacterium TMPK1]